MSGWSDALNAAQTW